MNSKEGPVQITREETKVMNGLRLDQLRDKALDDLSRSPKLAVG